MLDVSAGHWCLQRVVNHIFIVILLFCQTYFWCGFAYFALAAGSQTFGDLFLCMQGTCLAGAGHHWFCSPWLVYVVYCVVVVKLGHVVFRCWNWCWTWMHAVCCESFFIIILFMSQLLWVWMCIHCFGHRWSVVGWLCLMCAFLMILLLPDTISFVLGCLCVLSCGRVIILSFCCWCIFAVIGY